MEINKIYKLKKCDLNKVYTIFDFDPTTQKVFAVVKVRYADDLVKWLLKNFYENENWIKEVYNLNKKFFINELGLNYDKEGKIKARKRFKDIVTTWIVEGEVQEGGDRGISLRPLDVLTNFAFYNTKILDKYCGEIIQKLKEENLIIEEEIKE